jgi:Ca2+-binding EF-hand superfamily protein
MTSPTPAGSPATAMGARAADILKRFDKNGDGKLDEDEAAEAHEVMLREQRDQRITVVSTPAGKDFQAQMLQMFDKNHDGRLDEDERAEMQQYLRERGAQDFAGMKMVLLREFDKNGDGKIDDTEMVELVKVVRPRMERNPQQMKRFDKNGDGRLDDAEWAAAQQQIVRLLNAPLPAGVMVKATNAGDANSVAEFERARLDKVAQEVARRRAEREAAVQTGAATTAPAKP